MNRRIFLMGIGGATLSALNGCRSTTQSTLGRVVVYCSVDDVYARPILRDIEKRIGVRVDVIYDTEAAKTAGLATKIRAEKSRPQGDVFWSSALLQTLLLGREGLLQPYLSPAAADIDAAFKDAKGLWTGVGTRRHIIIHNAALKSSPRSLEDLLLPHLKGKVVLSNPQFGTSSDWAAALGVRWGIERTLKYFKALKTNEVQVVAGNSVAARRVASGEALAGLCDIDDFQAEAKKNQDLAWGRVEEPASINEIVIPGSAAILNGAPHLQNAKIFFDALVEHRVELALSNAMHSGGLARADAVKAKIPDDAARWPDAWKKLREPLNAILAGD
jgi:iron(III) transport system substrate-binding protein